MVASPSTAVTEQLAETELFAGLAADVLAEVAQLGRVQRLPRGTRIFAQGARADRCHALIDGQVRIAQSGVDGGQVLVRFVGAREMFGTVALFTDRHYPAEATAVIDSIEISWTEPVLHDLIQRYPAIALNLVRVIGTRLREVQERLRELATQRVEQRIAHALLRLAERDVSPSSENASIDFPLTRQDLAAMCGATLYTVSRVLTAWEKAGYLSTRRTRISIRKLSELRRLAGESPSSTALAHAAAPQRGQS